MGSMEARKSAKHCNYCGGLHGWKKGVVNLSKGYETYADKIIRL